MFLIAKAQKNDWINIFDSKTIASQHAFNYTVVSVKTVAKLPILNLVSLKPRHAIELLIKREGYKHTT